VCGGWPDAGIGRAWGLGAVVAIAGIIMTIPALRKLLGFGSLDGPGLAIAI